MLKKMRDKLNTSTSKTILAVILSLMVIVLILLSSFSLFEGKDLSIVKLIFGICVCVYSALLAFLFKIKPNILFFIFFLILSITNLVATLSNKSADWPTKLFGLLSLLLSVINLYLTFSVVPRVFTFKNLKIFYYIFIVFIFICCIFSFIFEFDSIVLLASRQGKEIIDPNNQIKSIFISKNYFGFYLLASIFSCFIIFENDNSKSRAIIYVCAILNTIFVFLTMCKTAICILILFYFFLFIKYLLNNRKTHKILCYFLLFVFVGLTTLFITFLSIPIIYNNIPLLKFVRTAFFENGLNSLIERVDWISKTKELILSPRIVVGYGIKTSLQAYYSVIGKYAPLDNAYFYNLISGGLLFIAFYFALIIEIYKRAVSVVKRSNKKGSTVVIFFSLFLIYGLFENFQLLSPRADSLIIGLIISSYIGVLLKDSNSQNSKKILHVVGSLEFGGTEAFIINYLQEMIKHGYSFDVFCFGNINEEMEKRFNSLGCRIYRGTKPNKSNFMKASREFKKFLVANPYKTIHLNANFDNAIYANAAYDLYTNNIVCHCHDTLTNIKFNAIKKVILAVKRTVIKISCNKFLACSFDAGCDILGKSFFKKNGCVIYNGLDLNKFKSKDAQHIKKLKEKYNIPDNKIILGNITRFEDKKNQKFLINLFNELPDKYILVLGGVDGGTLSSIKKMSNNKNIIFIGPRNDVLDWLQIFDYYLFPSLFEGLGIVAVESQLCGVKTIVSNFVPRETDLGIGLLKHLDLDTKLWKHEIALKPTKSIINFNDKKIEKYDIKKCVCTLEQIYEGNECE